jgi:hypothetical protein
MDDRWTTKNVNGTVFGGTSGDTQFQCCAKWGKKGMIQNEGDNFLREMGSCVKTGFCEFGDEGWRVLSKIETLRRLRKRTGKTENTGESQGR